MSLFINIIVNNRSALYTESVDQHSILLQYTGIIRVVWCIQLDRSTSFDPVSLETQCYDKNNINNDNDDDYTVMTTIWRGARKGAFDRCTAAARTAPDPRAWHMVHPHWYTYSWTDVYTHIIHARTHARIAVYIYYRYYDYYYYY